MIAVSPSDMLSPVSLSSGIMRGNTTVFGACTAFRRHTPRTSYEQRFGGLNRRFRHAPGRYQLLARVMEQGHHHCHLESFVCRRHFATLSDDGSGMGRTETTYQHSQARRRLRRSARVFDGPILEVEDRRRDYGEMRFLLWEK
jgi:hypothetical protein